MTKQEIDDLELSDIMQIADIVEVSVTQKLLIFNGRPHDISDYKGGKCYHVELFPESTIGKFMLFNKEPMSDFSIVEICYMYYMGRAESEPINSGVILN